MKNFHAIWSEHVLGIARSVECVVRAAVNPLVALIRLNEIVIHLLRSLRNRPAQYSALRLKAATPLAFLLPLFLGTAAFAQTTTWNPSDKDAGITLSGGNLVATSSATNAYKAVRGTVAKFSGQWCYQFTVNNPTSNFNIGVSNAAYSLNNIDGIGINDGAQSPASNNASVGLSSDGIVHFHSQGTVSDPAVNGKTGEVCVNLDPQPPQIWVTPDVTGTSGAAGGPKWNGSTTATPIGNVSGQKFALPFSGVEASSLGTCCYFPIFQGYNADKVTAAFGGFTPPTGYSTWNTSGGGSPIPGPMSPLTINIANAPEWQATHAYALKDRILAGPAWSVSYTNGLDLCLWAVKAITTGTSGSSASAFNTPCSSGTPANYGGGLDGTIPSQWASAATVTDGGVTWVLLTKVNYNTLTAAFVDEPISWAASTPFSANDYVRSGNNVYMETTGISSTNPSCTSGASAPTGTSTPSDGGCVWAFRGTIPYSSQTHRFPHFGGVIGGTSGGNNTYRRQRFYYDVNIHPWYGGAQRKRYWAGNNNEADPIRMANHTSGQYDHPTYCYQNGDFGFWFGPDFTFGEALNDNQCNGIIRRFEVVFETALGDSFGENISSNIAVNTPLRYNENQGVAIYGDASGAISHDNYSNGTPLATQERGVHLNKLQIRSENGPAMYWTFDHVFISHSLFDAGGSFVVGQTTFWMDNSIIISRSTEAGCSGFMSRYDMHIWNSTFIGMGTTDCAAIRGAAFAQSTYNGLHPIRNNLFFGFPRLYDLCGIVDGSIPGNCSGLGSGVTGPGMFSDANNQTDMPNWAGIPNTLVHDPASSMYGGGLSFLPWPAVMSGFNNTCGPGNTSSCQGLSASDVFVNSTIGPNLDLRLKAGSPVIGAGADFSLGLPPPPLGLATSPGPDILGTARPQ